ACLIGAAPSSDAASSAPSVDVVKVQGIIDPSLAGYVRGTIADAETAGSTVILQVDSGGAYGSRAQELAREVRDASVPVVTWGGPPGAQVQGASLFLFYSAHLTAMSPGAG